MAAIVARNRRWLGIIASTTYLLLLITASTYALRRIERLSLPIPSWLATAVRGLAIIACLFAASIAINGDLSTLHDQDNPYRTPALIGLLILKIGLATLIGTYIYSADDVISSLSKRWTRMYEARDEGRIRTIQDDLDCCGYNSTVDMAFPFPRPDDNGILRPSNCSQQYNRTQSCLDPWRAEETGLAGLLLAVIALVALWELVLLMGLRGAGWLKASNGDEESMHRGDVVEEGNRGEQVERFLDEPHEGSRLINAAED